MFEFIDLDRLLGGYVDSVTLKGDLANSTLKLFGNLTNRLVEEHQAHMRRQSNQFKVDLSRLFNSPDWKTHLGTCDYKRFIVSKSRYEPLSLALFGQK